ncbi:hypothetical protein O6H91_07G109000 [Diphasiastrum complanatum]|uniref:Uncharacterized protein n=1 Tax=Diphasiastrum complanatum TaxID=34168 RepID=A0ACC2D8E6_DIPCM|nr:hypothetical protein O6H91_07G109000 [Diphasiastrum complanatum]
MASLCCHICLFTVILCLYTLPAVFCGRVSRNIHKRFSFSSYSFGDKYDDINLLGSASVESRGSIRIPADDDFEGAPQHQAGRALYSSPVRMWDPDTGLAASFNTTFSFIINNQPAKGNKSASGGGLTFIVAPDELTVGREAGWLGMLNEHPCKETYNAFAVEFDNFKNDEFNDPNDNHVGINLASMQSSHTADASLAGVFLRNGSFVTAWINYNGDSRHLEVHIANASTMERPLKPIISVPLDLSPILKEYMFVGFTAATGGAEAQTHNIVSWNFSSKTHAVPRFPNKFLKSESLCNGNVSDGKIQKQKKHSRESEAFLIFLSVSVVIFLAFINLACARTGTKQTAMKVHINNHRPRPLHKPRKFNYEELSAATNDFSEKEKLGQGRFGSVYKGVLQDGSLVAVKRLSSLQIQGSEKRLIKKISHILGQKQPHLVQLRGWCREKKELLLVNEYMPNGSLDTWLYPNPWTALPWLLRWKIIKNIASSLAYLHEGLDQQLLHRQVKTSNVLLDISLEAKLGDFGIGSWIEDRQARLLNPAAADYHIAYQAPDSASYTRKATDKMDVFSFGVTTMEIVCGRRPIDKNLAPAETVLLKWVWELHKTGNLLAAADKRMKNQYHPEQLMRSLTVGILCTHPDPNCRPTMKKVVSFLTGKKALPPLLSKPAEGSVTVSSKDTKDPLDMV